MSEMTRYEQDSKLVNLILIASQAFLKVRKAELSPYSITPEGARILRAINVLKENATRAEIARCLFQEPNTVFNMVNRMGKKGLVKISQIPGNNNRVIVLTEKGKKAYQAISEKKVESLSRITSYLSDEEERELISQLERLTENLFQQLGTHRIPPMDL